MNKKIKILNAEQIQQKIDRIACQILEDCFEEKEIILAGVYPKGEQLAERLKNAVEKIMPSMSISKVKIQLDKNENKPVVHLSIPIESCENKTIIVIDDVLDSGRTLAKALSVFLNTTTKKIRTVVLVNRNHHLFPILVDFSGIEISTVAQEHIQVELHPAEQNELNAVYLM